MALLSAVMSPTGQWTPEQAHSWRTKQRWEAGCNFIPSTAINQLEMWQAATFDLATIDREFTLMQQTGLSIARIYLHDLAYESDPQGFKLRMKSVVGLAKKHRIRILFTIFDDCWNPDPKLGTQPKPRPGVHNSGWVQSPSKHQRNWPADLPRLKRYVQDIVQTFKSDPTVYMWDLYNEPGNSGYGESSLPLLRSVFDWAREIRPKQPLTAAAFAGGENVVDRACTELSDVVTFHCYDGPAELQRQIKYYQSLGRPVVCSEWMARTNNSLISTNLPIFVAAEVPCVQWGFVSGKTNTIFPWGSKEGSPEPNPWFHDLYRTDGTPFDPVEIALYKRLGLPPKASTSTPQRLPILPNRQNLPGLRLLADMPLRDPSVCRGPDGSWYLTGTVEPFWDYNTGIKVWLSRDMVHWDALGFVYKYGASPWHKPYLQAKKPLWAPEIHYLKGTFWLTYSLPGYDGTGKTSGCGLLKSTSGKPEGPYIDVHPNERLGDEIDASLFEDTDESVYFLWHSGKIAKMSADMSRLSEPYHWLRSSASDPAPDHHSGLCEGIFGKGSFDHVGYEGVFLMKRAGTYYLTCSEMIDGRYSCMVATSKSIYGPYSARSEVIPHGGHNMFFSDETGKLWSTIFGSDGDAPWQERPGILPMKFSRSGALELDSR